MHPCAFHFRGLRLVTLLSFAFCSHFRIFCLFMLKKLRKKAKIPFWSPIAIEIPSVKIKLGWPCKRRFVSKRERKGVSVYMKYECMRGYYEKENKRTAALGVFKGQQSAFYLLHNLFFNFIAYGHGYTADYKSGNR